MNVESLLENICKKSPMQQKKLEAYLSTKDDDFHEEFSEFLRDYNDYLASIGLTMEYGVDAYLKMVKDMFNCQIKFMRTGKYPMSLANEAYENVYNNKKEMLSYMIGLAISQYLWSSHYEMFRLLKDALNLNKDSIENYVEIGPGHGLFLKNAIDILDDDVQMTAIDISPVSLDVSKSIIKYFFPSKNVTCINEDMINLDLDSKCDFVVMGEVIEHVEQPQLLLKKINKLLAKSGRAFLSTCVNCPAIDHVYHFHKVDEIREMFLKCGLKIESEKVLPVEELPMSEIVKQKITINYAAIVTKV